MEKDLLKIEIARSNKGLLHFALFVCSFRVGGKNYGAWRSLFSFRFPEMEFSEPRISTPEFWLGEGKTQYQCGGGSSLIGTVCSSVSISYHFPNVCQPFATT